MNFTWQNEHITNIHTVGRDKKLVCLFLSRYIHYWIKPSGKTTKQNTSSFSFFCTYSCLPIPNISHQEGTCMQTSSFSFINDDLQIKPFGARSWHFPKQTMKSKDQSLSCSKQEGTCSKEWSWKCILVTNWQLPNGRLQCDIVVLLHCLFWVGSHVLMQMSWPLGSDLWKQSRCWQWLAAGTAGV